MAPTKPKNKFRRKKLLITLSLIVTVLVIIGGWLYIQSRIAHPLGDQLEYIGKRDYGCSWLCDSPPSTTYSYATSMTPPELVEYFPKAEIINKSDDIEQWRGRGSPFLIHFINKESNNRFSISFYKSADELTDYFDLSSTEMPYVIDIESDEYQLAKDSL